MDREAERRIEITVRIWRNGARRQFERYVRRLLKLLPEHGGNVERRASQVGTGPRSPDAVLVLSFPDAESVNGYLTDPRRDDLDDLAARVIARSLITSGRTHEVQEHAPGVVTALPQPPSNG